MREFSRSETMLEKCHYCGCKNKLYTHLLNKDETIVGYTLRCCNCGRIVTFIYPEFTEVSMKNYINGYYHAGPHKCIQESYCPHKNCGLYGSCLHPQPPKDNDKKYNEKCDCECNFLNQSELKVKALNEPRFL